MACPINPFKSFLVELCKIVHYQLECDVLLQDKKYLIVAT